MVHLLWIYSDSSAIIQNNTFAENNISGTVYDLLESSTIQLDHVTFIRNKMICCFGSFQILALSFRITHWLKIISHWHCAIFLGVPLLNYFIIRWLEIALSTCFLHINIILKLMQSLLRTTHFLNKSWLLSTILVLIKWKFEKKMLQAVWYIFKAVLERWLLRILIIEIISWYLLSRLPVHI